MDPHRGIDLHTRPGVPMEQHVDGAPNGTLSRQPSADREVLHEPGQGLTPVFGTGPSPKGLSGGMRRLAYRAPDYRVSRWLLLLIADRIDWCEHMFSRPRTDDGETANGTAGRLEPAADGHARPRLA